MTNWETKPLGEVCAIARGGSPRPIRTFLTDADDGINWIKISDATASGKYIYATAEKIKPAGALRSRLVNDGDFLLSNSMSFGRPYIMRTTGCVHDGWLVLSNYEGSFNQDFLYHLLGSPQVFGQFDRLAAGSTVRNLNIDLASRVFVPIPPAREQLRIVGILDEAFAGIATAKANAEKNLQNARELIAGMTQELFPHDAHGPGDHTLDELCDLIVDCEHKTAPTQKHGIPSIRTPNIGKGELNLDGVYRVSDETYMAWTRRAEPASGDLILAREAPAGNVAVVPDGMKVCLGQRTVLLRPKREIFESAYLALMLLQSNSQRRLLSHSRGATVQHINMKDIRAFKVAEIPALDAQRAVVTRAKALEKQERSLVSIYQRKLAALDALKQSLLHQAFSGQL